MRVLVLVAVLLGACNSKRAPESTDPPVATKAARAKPDAGVRAAKQPIASPLPEVGPHPDYPTPVAAGTDKIFMLEEPDRGPKAPLDFKLPPTDSLAWTVETNCDPGTLAVVCGGTKPNAKARRSWRLARKGTLVIAESRRGDMVDETYVYVTGADGAPKQRVHFDARGRVDAAFTFVSATRFSGRERDGSNALEGCGYKEFELDKNHRLAQLRCLQWLGDPMRDLHGVATTRYVRDAHGFVTDELRLGLDDKPIAANDGIHHVRYELDPSGRAAVERYLGVDDKPVASTKGCHGRRFERDERELVTRITCLGADDKPSNDTTGASLQDFTYNLRGCRTGMRFHSAPGGPSQDHGADYVVDDWCAVTSHTCVNAKGDRQACGTGDPARYDYKRDEHGNAISTSYYAVDGSPMKDPVYGAFEVRMTFDALDNGTGRACFDNFGKPMPCGRLGFHREKSERDDAGREVSRTFFSETGASAKNINAHTRRFRYDNYDHLFEQIGYDAEGNVVESNGMATRRDLWDAAHRLFAVVILDRAGQPARYTGCYAGTTCPKEWHAVRILRRPDGEAERNEFFDAAGQLIQTTDCKKTRCFK